MNRADTLEMLFESRHSLAKLTGKDPFAHGGLDSLLVALEAAARHLFALDDASADLVAQDHEDSDIALNICLLARGIGRSLLTAAHWARRYQSSLDTPGLFRCPGCQRRASVPGSLWCDAGCP